MTDTSTNKCEAPYLRWLRSRESRLDAQWTKQQKSYRIKKCFSVNRLKEITYLCQINITKIDESAMKKTKLVQIISPKTAENL